MFGFLPSSSTVLHTFLRSLLSEDCLLVLSVWFRHKSDHSHLHVKRSYIHVPVKSSGSNPIASNPSNKAPDGISSTVHTSSSGPSGSSSIASSTKGHQLFVAPALRSSASSSVSSASSSSSSSVSSLPSTGAEMDIIVFDDVHAHPSYCPPILLATRLMGCLIVLVGSFLKLSLCWSAYFSPTLVRAPSFPVQPILFEMVNQMVGIAFNWRMGTVLSAYGEVYMLFAQNFFLVWCVHMHRRQMLRFYQLVVVGLLIFWLLIDMVTADQLLLAAAYMGIPLQLICLIPPILRNYGQKHTIGFPLGMVFLGFCMSGCRIISTLVEVIGLADPTDDVHVSDLAIPVNIGDAMGVIIGSCTGPILNACLLIQVVWYRKSTQLAIRGEAPRIRPSQSLTDLVRPMTQRQQSKEEPRFRHQNLSRHELGSTRPRKKSPVRSEPNTHDHVE